MAVAKSYENFEIKGEPFSENGKMYVIVSHPCPRCGGSGNYSYNPMNGSTCFRCNGRGREDKKVRWYSEAQRATMDHAAAKRTIVQEEKKEVNRIKFAARNAFGFGEQGFITVFKGDQNVLNDWAHETNPCRARYNTIFGWFCPARLPIENLPEGIQPIRVDWNDVRDESDSENLMMRDSEEVAKYIKRLTTDASTSTYQGEIGTWIEREITVMKNAAVENRFGGAHIHIMHDNDGNEYVWSTGSKNIAEGTKMKMKMKVKDHNEREGVCQTIVYYCKELV